MKAKHFLVILFSIFSLYTMAENLDSLYKKDYPKKMGSIRVNQDVCSYGNVYFGEHKTIEIKMVNVGDKDINFTPRNLPFYMNVEITPKTVKPGEKGLIKVTLLTDTLNRYGLHYYRMGLHTNDKVMTVKLFSISVFVREDFSKMTEEDKENAPRISYESNTFDFGTITSGDKVTHKFMFTNTGKSDLIIRRVRASCGCTATEPDKKIIKPGETGYIKVVFNSVNRYGAVRKSISVTTNDPKFFQSTLIIKGKINKKQ